MQLWMEQLIQDSRQAVRHLRKNPGFAALAVITLALGTGANTAMFSVMEGVLFRPLPFHNATKLMAIGMGRFQGEAQTISWLNYSDIRDRSRSLTDVSAYVPDLSVLTTARGSQHIPSLTVTSNLMGTLGVHPRIGRGFLGSDCITGAPPVVIFGSDLWRDQFAANPQILGQQVLIGKVPHTVIGVMPDHLPFPRDEADMTGGVWLPLRPSSEMMKDRDTASVYVIAKLNSKTNRRAAEGDLNAIARTIRESERGVVENLTFNIEPFTDVITASVRPALESLSAALFLVLIVACLNVTNLQLARYVQQRQEWVVRLALGAQQNRLLRQMVTESAVISILGAGLGLQLALLLLNVVRYLPADVMPRAEEIHFRFGVFSILALFATFATLASSVSPAVFAIHLHPEEILHEASRGFTSGVKRTRLSDCLVIGEAALAAILLVSTGLMFRTVYSLEHVNWGFNPKQVVSFMSMPAGSQGFFSMFDRSEANNPESNTRSYKSMLDQLRHEPAVLNAALTSSVPLDGMDIRTTCEIVGKETKETERQNSEDQVQIRAVSSGYASVLRIPVIKGRMISDQDSATAPFVAMVNQTFMRRRLAKHDPIGYELSLAGLPRTYVIVGVLGDTVQTTITGPTAPEVDLSYQQLPASSPFFQIMLAARTSYVLKIASKSVVGNIREALRQSNPGYVIDNFTTLTETMKRVTVKQRLSLFLVSSFAAVAIVMVMAGVYGVLSQITGLRRREIGVRVSLGASGSYILRMILRHGLIQILLGLALGFPIVFAIGRLLGSFLFGVTTLDPVTYLASAITMIVLGTLAAFLPAYRAAIVDPLTSLRSE